MKEHEWIKEFPVAVRFCDEEGILLEINDKTAKIFESNGGHKLIGSNILNCHSDTACTKTERQLATREKNDDKRLIYQSPWNRNGEYAGFVELSPEIPFEVLHFIRS